MTSNFCCTGSIAICEKNDVQVTHLTRLRRLPRNLKVTGSPRGGRGQTICSSPFFSHRKYASEIKLSRHKAGMVDNMQTNHHYSSSHCSRCTLVKSVPANYSPKISSAKTASKSILLLGDTP